RADELAGAVLRKLRIGVERDDVPHRPQHLGTADDVAEAVFGAAAEELVEFIELAALSLPAHPDAFLRVPPPRAMEEEEDVVPLRGVFAIERVDRLLGGLEQRVVAGHVLLRSVGE